MQVSERINEGLKRGYTINLTAAELDAKVDAKLEEARPNVQLKGFRKGKVPMSHMKKMYGKSVLGEALQEAIDTAINDHLKESGERPAARPDVKMVNEDWQEGQDVEVSVDYEVLPDIPEVDLSDLSIETLKVEVDDASVDESLNNLAASAKDYEAREEGAKAENDDQVVIDFEGFVDGEAFEGGKGEDYPLVLGSNSFIPGFEEQLVGVASGEEKDVNVTFPSEYNAEHLAGKEALFKVTVKDVRQPVDAKLSDDLAKKYGAESLDQLKENIRERLGEEFKDASRAVTKRRLMDALDGKVQFDVPPSMVEAEAKQIAHQLWHEENPDQQQGHDHPEVEPTDEHNKLAERRVRLGLFLAEIGNKAEINVTEEEMRNAIMRQAMQYGAQARQFYEFLQKNPQAQEQIRAPIFEDKVVDHIVKDANVTEKTVTKDQLEKEIEALDQL